MSTMIWPKNSYIHNGLHVSLASGRLALVQCVGFPCRSRLGKAILSQPGCVSKLLTLLLDPRRVTFCYKKLRLCLHIIKINITASKHYNNSKLLAIVSRLVSDGGTLSSTNPHRSWKIWTCHGFFSRLGKP